MSPPAAATAFLPAAPVAPPRPARARAAACARRRAHPPRASVSLPTPPARPHAHPTEEGESSAHARSAAPEASPRRIFDAAALDGAVAGTAGLLVFEVYSSRCRACMAMKRTVRKTAARFAGRASFLQLDADDDIHLAQRLGIRAMPTFILYKDGKRVDHFASSSGDRLQLYIEDNL